MTRLNKRDRQFCKQVFTFTYKRELKIVTVVAKKYSYCQIKILQFFFLL